MELITKNFDYFIKDNILIKSDDSKLEFTLDLLELNKLVIPALKIIESSSSSETLIKFEVFKNSIIKVSTLNQKIFCDTLILAQDISQFNNDYFSFVIDSEKFLKFISILDIGKIIFNIDYASKTLALHFNTLEINLELKDLEEFLNYEKTLANTTVISDFFESSKIKQSLDFSHNIFSKHDDINKSKEIHIDNDLIYASHPYIGCSVSKFEYFANMDYVITHDNIKIISAVLPLFNSTTTKVFTTEKSIVIKDQFILFGFPIPESSIKELKTKVTNLVLDQKSLALIQVDRKSLIRSLNILSIFLKDLSDDEVLFTFSKDTLKVSICDLVTTRESYDVFKIMYSGPTINIKLKFDNLLKNFKYFGNREVIDFEILEINDSLKGVRIKEEYLDCSFISVFFDNSIN